MTYQLIWVGGGHNPSGASSTNGGLVVDLSKYLNKVIVDQEAKIAHVGRRCCDMSIWTSYCRRHRQRGQ